MAGGGGLALGRWGVLFQSHAQAMAARMQRRAKVPVSQGVALVRGGGGGVGKSGSGVVCVVLMVRGGG